MSIFLKPNSHLVFYKILFEVQVNDIPINFMSKRVEESIYEIIGGSRGHLNQLMMIELILYGFMS